MTGFDAAHRSAERELMDDDAVDFETFRGCLVDLARVNRLSLGYRPTLGFLERLRRTRQWPRDRAVKIIDVGCGYGDTLREIARWAKARDLQVELVGVDRTPWAARAAAAATPDKMPIAWRTADVFDVSADADVVISALFTHHLGDEDVVRFVGWMEAGATLGWFVNDLQRSRVAYDGFKVLSAALRMHRFVRHDGPVSFARSFRADDWRRYTQLAGLAAGAAEVQSWTPFRLCVARLRER